MKNWFNSYFHFHIKNGTWYLVFRTFEFIIISKDFFITCIFHNFVSHLHWSNENTEWIICRWKCQSKRLEKPFTILSLTVNSLQLRCFPIIFQAIQHYIIIICAIFSIIEICLFWIIEYKHRRRNVYWFFTAV